MLGLSNHLNWNLSFRQTFTGKRGDALGEYLKPTPIPPISISIKSPLLLVGIGSESAKPSWYKGAYATLLLPISPSSTSQFLARVDTYRDRMICRLGYLTLLDFTYWSTPSYQLQLHFPRYIEDVFVEVWEYSENVEGIFTPASTDQYSQANDVKAVRAYLESREFEVVLRSSNED